MSRWLIPRLVQRWTTASSRSSPKRRWSRSRCSGPLPRRRCPEGPVAGQRHQGCLRGCGCRFRFCGSDISTMRGLSSFLMIVQLAETAGRSAPGRAQSFRPAGIDRQWNRGRSHDPAKPSTNMPGGSRVSSGASSSPGLVSARGSAGMRGFQELLQRLLDLVESARKSSIELSRRPKIRRRKCCPRSDRARCVEVAESGKASSGVSSSLCGPRSCRSRKFAAGGWSGSDVEVPLRSGKHIQRLALAVPSDRSTTRGQAEQRMRRRQQDHRK